MSDPVIPSAKPYLIRAIYEWCMDSGFTPYIAVVVDANTRVPMEYVRNGEIVLNIGAVAANKLQLGNEFVELQARFGGAAREISVPITAISTIYARENGRGMSFDTASGQSTSVEPGGVTGVTPAPLSTVEVDATDATDVADAGPTPPDTPPARPSGKPALRRIK